MVAVLGLGATMRLRAQTGDFNLVSSPLPVILTANPGETVSADLRVKNGGSQTERLKVTLFKFKVDENGSVQLLNREEGDHYFDWVTLNPMEFSAAPNEWKTVKMTVAVPKEAALGYYYAVGFSRAAEAQTVPGAATLQGQLITFVLLEAKVPYAKRELKVSEFTADKSMYEFLPALFKVKVNNTGNLHVSPKGDIFVHRGKSQVAALKINPNQGNVLPKSSRTFSVEWSDGFPVYQKKEEDGKAALDKNGQQVKALKWDFSKASSLRIGKYTAKMVLVYDDGQRDVPIQGEVSFWVVPWRLLLGLLVVTILVGIGLWTTGRNLWRKLKRVKTRQP